MTAPCSFCQGPARGQWRDERGGRVCYACVRAGVVSAHRVERSGRGSWGEYVRPEFAIETMLRGRPVSMSGIPDGPEFEGLKDIARRVREGRVR